MNEFLVFLQLLLSFVNRVCYLCGGSSAALRLEWRPAAPSTHLAFALIMNFDSLLHFAALSFPFLYRH